MTHTARHTHIDDRPRHGHVVSTDQVAAFIEMDRRKAGSDWDGSRSTGGETRAASGGPRGAAVGSQPTERADGLTAALGGLRGVPQPSERVAGLTTPLGGLRDVGDPRDEFPTPEIIRSRIRRTAVVPATITVPCDKHGAEVGAYCFSTAHGVCAERVIARAAKR